jgi:hypothetical protein
MFSLIIREFREKILGNHAGPRALARLPMDGILIARKLFGNHCTASFGEEVS